MTQPMSSVGSVRITAQPTIGVAVLGTGSVGMKHLESLARLAEVRAFAVPTRRDRLRELAHLGYATAATVEEAAGLEVSLCIIATDTGRHVEDGLTAMERGLDVLIEKPLARDAQEARHLTDRTRVLGRNAFVGCVLRFSESLTTFRELLPQLGPLHAVRIECQSYLPDWRPHRPYQDTYSAREDEGGVLRDLIHEIDYAGWIFGWPKALQARVKNLRRLGILAEEIAELSWESEEGFLVSISLDYLTKPSRRWMRACGERGMMEWDGERGIVTITVDGGPVRTLHSSQPRQDMFREQAKAFVRASQGRRDSRLATAAEGMKALAICDAARGASESRREVTVEYP